MLRKQINPVVAVIAILLVLIVIGVPCWYFINREPPPHPRTNALPPPQAGMSWDPSRGGMIGLPTGDLTKRRATFVAPPPSGVFTGDPMRGGMPPR